MPFTGITLRIRDKSEVSWDDLEVEMEDVPREVLAQSRSFDAYCRVIDLLQPFNSEGDDFERVDRTVSLEFRDTDEGVEINVTSDSGEDFNHLISQVNRPIRLMLAGLMQLSEKMLLEPVEQN